MMNTTTNAPTHVVVVALHESLNVNLNIFNDIITRISTQRESRFSRRLSRKTRQVLGKVCRVAGLVSSTVRRIVKRKTKDEGFANDDELVVCVDLDERIHTSANVFHDIARSIYQRSVNALKDYQHEGGEKEVPSSDTNVKDVENSKKHRFRRILNAVMHCLICSAETSGMDEECRINSLQTLNNTI